MQTDFETYVSGHRNPDIDSLAAATALAKLRERQTKGKVTALCPGLMPDRASYLFQRFGVTPPMKKSDVYLRVRDLLDDTVPAVHSGTTLLDAVKMLGESKLSQLAIVDNDNRFLGMLSAMSLLSRLLNIGNDAGTSLTGRRIYTSLNLIKKALEAEDLSMFEPDVQQKYEVYVAAMSGNHFEEHLPDNNRELAIIVGDRPEIHLRALQRKIRLLIISGSNSVEPLILKEALQNDVSILYTPLDSATVIRRLKFSVPVEMTQFAVNQTVLSPNERIRDIRHKIINQPEDGIPVCENGVFQGVLFKKALSMPPPFRMILVDHNELEQSIAGVEEVPVIEVVDHHRIGMAPTNQPIKITADVVGSSCTLVASMYRSCGESLNAEFAGILLGGVVSDTLNLKSPTTSALDIKICEWLEKISGVTGTTLMEELLKVDSPLAVKKASEVVNGDRKDYSEGKVNFALAQVEETNLELLHQRKDELVQAMNEELEKKGLDFFGLLVTDAVRETSELLVLGNPVIISNLPYSQVSDDVYSLPGVLSRKKQLLPQLLSVISTLQHEL